MQVLALAIASSFMCHPGVCTCPSMTYSSASLTTFPLTNWLTYAVTENYLPAPAFAFTYFSSSRPQNPLANAGAASNRVARRTSWGKTGYTLPPTYPLTTYQ